MAVIATFIAGSAVIGLLCHGLIRIYWLASLVAAIVAVVALQAINYLEIGYLDPFWPIASAVGFTIALPTAALVGIPFVMMRVRSKQVGK